MKTDMTKGNPLRLILMFAFPLFLSSLFQQFYNIADTAIVGHALGDHALSAVGAVGSVFGLISSICFGLTNGFAILISRYFGAGDEKKMKQAIAGTIVLSLSATVLITGLAVFVLKPALRLLHTPKEIFDDAYQYIYIIVLCCVVMVGYNMLSSILRALGNSLVPLIFLIISSLLNIGMDLLFIKSFHMGIAGAAWATVLAQGISGLFCLIYIIRYCPSLRLSKEDFKIPGELIRELLLSGIAMSLMWAVVNMGTVILQSGINGLGADTIAAHISARKISEIYMMVGSALASTIATFASQNYGASQMKRVWTGVKITHILSWIWATFVIVITMFFADAMVAALTGSQNQEIIKTGAKYLRINLPFYYILYVLCILRSTLQGIGCKFWPVVASMLEMIGKVLCVLFFVKPFGYTAICFCEPITWIVCGILVSVVFFVHKDMKPVIFTGQKPKED